MLRGAAGGRVRRSTVAETIEPEDRGLFERLRAWRAEVAREHGVPAYVVFNDATLRALAAVRPGSLADLDGITGIGAKKRDTYGEAVLEVISAA